MRNNLKVGVFLCECGGNISDTIDLDEVRNSLDVEFIGQFENLCSLNGRKIIRDAIFDYNLDRVVVAACSPISHEKTFQDYVKPLNPYLMDMANIREQCSWVHKDMPVGTEKAIILAKAAVAKVHLNAPLIAGQSNVTKRALVIGGGIAGIQTALDIADAGYEVDIVEKTPTIGGKMAQLDKTFPTLDCAACILTPKMVDAKTNELVNLYTYSEVESVKGFVGNFNVKIRKKASYVNNNLCTGCGACYSICPCHCIEMVKDDEGFLYPQVNQQMCRACKLCETICPINH